MVQLEDVIHRLTTGVRIDSSSLDQVPREQGLYALWLDETHRVCLKVGIAGPRSGKGLRERLAYHFSSHPNNSVLAQHLGADTTSVWAATRHFDSRDERRAFLRERCYFHAVVVPDVDTGELRRLEALVIAALTPRYAGRVKKSPPLEP